MNFKFSLKNVFIISIIFILSSCDNPYSDKGFTSLFNGENFDGWYLKLRNNDAEMAKKVYAIEDKMVHVFNDSFPDTIDLKGKNGTHGLFYTDKVYSRFILRFEYKWGSKIANNFDKWQYDAGCYYHVIDDKIWPVGLEYQIRYNHLTERNHTADFWASEELTWYADTTGTKYEYINPEEGGVLLEGKKGELWASKTAPYHALNNQWNKCEVIVMGDKYAIHKLNGKIVNRADNLPFSEGKIGFQSETAEIYYQNITIKEFEKEIAISKFLK